MVWWFIFLTFSTPAMFGKKITKHANLIAFFGGLVFMVHPVQTQAVTYISQRAASLATLFYLVCLSLYVKSRLLQQQGEAPAASSIFYYWSLMISVMAMFTKEIAMTLPLMVLLYEYCFLRTKEKFNWKYPAPFLATILIIPLTMFLTKFVDFAGMRNALEPLPDVSPWQYLLTQFRVVVTYIRLLFIPINQNLDYDYPIAKHLLDLPTLASLILLVLILIIAIRAFSKYRLISFGIFWFFLTLLPESSIIPIRDVIFEHRLYLPMVGFSFFLVSVIYYIFENRSFKLMVMALIIITSCYTVLAYERNLIWKDDLTLWNDTMHKSPNKVRPIGNRGLAYFQQGNFTQAISDFTKAIEIDPNYAKTYNNRGAVYGRQGKLPQAISDYTKAIEIDPNYADAYNNRGAIYSQQGSLPQAISDYTKAIEIDPDYADAYNNRGNAYCDKGSLPQAILDFTKAIEIDPDYADAYNNRGAIYGQQGNLPQAIADFTKAIGVDPGYAAAYNNRSFSYYTAKEYDKAWADLHKAGELGYSVDLKFLDALKKASGREK
jgi:Flp pilus assembly protein TadD